MQIVDLAIFQVVECRKDAKKVVELQKLKVIVDVEIFENKLVECRFFTNNIVDLQIFDVIVDGDFENVLCRCQF